MNWVMELKTSCLVLGVVLRCDHSAALCASPLRQPIASTGNALHKRRCSRRNVLNDLS